MYLKLQHAVPYLSTRVGNEDVERNGMERRNRNKPTMLL